METGALNFMRVAFDRAKVTVSACFLMIFRRALCLFPTDFIFMNIHIKLPLTFVIGIFCTRNFELYYHSF